MPMPEDHDQERGYNAQRENTAAIVVEKKAKKTAVRVRESKNRHRVR